MLYVLVVLLSVLATPLANPVPVPEAKAEPAPEPLAMPDPKPAPLAKAKAEAKSQLDGVCEDIDQGCAGWKESGFCETHKDLMSYYCPASCGTCSRGPAADVYVAPTASYYAPQETAAYNPYPDAAPAYEPQTPYNYDRDYDSSYTSDDKIKQETGYVIAKIIQDVKTKGDIGGGGDCAGSVDNGKLVGVKKGEYGNVECNEGFKLTGSYYVFCNYEGQIEGDVATCEKNCNDWTVEGAKLTPLDGNSGWLFFECLNGRVMTGESWIWCDGGKVDALPTCAGGAAPVAPTEGYVDPYAPVDPYVDPYAPQDPYVDPYAPQDPYVDPYAPQDPYVDPYAPQDPYVDPYAPQDPYVDPYAVQDPYVDPYAPVDPYVPYATAAPVDPYVDPYATAAPVPIVPADDTSSADVATDTGKCNLPVVPSGSWSDPYGDGNYWFLKCNDGFLLEGTDYLYCDETGAVFGDAGKCLEDKCNAVVENGVVGIEKVGDYYVYAQITCNEGFEITGTGGTYCTPSTGEFSDPLGTCTSIMMKKQ